MKRFPRLVRYINDVTERLNAMQKNLVKNSDDVARRRLSIRRVGRQIRFQPRETAIGVETPNGERR